MKQSDEQEAFDVESWAKWIASVEGIPYKRALEIAEREYAVCDAEGIDRPGPVAAMAPAKGRKKGK